MNLPDGIVAMLRGNAGYSAEWADLAWLAQKSYQEGRAGQPYEPDLPTDGLFTDAKVKKSDRHPPFKHIYVIVGKPRNRCKSKKNC